MKLLTRNTDYAIRAVCSMASKRGSVVTVDELVEELKIPRPFLRKILQILSKSGIVFSTRGAGGGFKLASSAYKVTLADLMGVFQGPLSINECTFRKKICPDTTRCPLKMKIERIGNYVDRELRSISMGDLLRG